MSEMKERDPISENEDMKQKFAPLGNNSDDELKRFLTVCKDIGQYKGKEFDEEVVEHLRNTSAWKMTFYDISCQVANTPLLVILGDYAKSCIKDPLEGKVRVKLLEHLVQNIDVFRSSLKVHDVKQMRMVKILDLIRCQRKWNYQQREAIIKEFLEFWRYLNDQSVGYIEPAYDPLKKKYENRDLSYKKFIAIVDMLSLRERTIAELLYFGEGVNLNDVFTLAVESIDCKNDTVHFMTLSEYYPKHVMQDLKDVVGKRKQGSVFLGKSGKAIDPTVPYRALKNAVYELNLHPTFSFKNFTESR